MTKQGGKTANKLGQQLESMVEKITKDLGYEYVCTNKFFLAAKALNQKIYTKQLQVSESIYSTDDKKYYCKADFVIFNPKNNMRYLIIECKSQTSSGSIDEKYPYLNENIKQYPHKTIIVLCAPAARTGAVEWLKSQEGNNKKLIKVFENFSKFRAWAHKKLN